MKPAELKRTLQAAVDILAAELTLLPAELEPPQPTYAADDAAIAAWQAAGYHIEEPD